MKTLIGGAVAAALGLIGLAIWWGPFLMVLAGIIPIMLLLGGGLAIYLGFDELKDTWKKDEPVSTPTTFPRAFTIAPPLDPPIVSDPATGVMERGEVSATVPTAMIGASGSPP